MDLSASQKKKYKRNKTNMRLNFIEWNEKQIEEMNRQSGEILLDKRI